MGEMFSVACNTCHLSGDGDNTLFMQTTHCKKWACTACVLRQMVAEQGKSKVACELHGCRKTIHVKHSASLEDDGKFRIVARRSSPLEKLLRRLTPHETPIERTAVAQNRRVEFAGTHTFTSQRLPRARPGSTDADEPETACETCRYRPRHNTFFFRTSGCRHVFCVPCMLSHLAIAAMPTIPCPRTGCGQPINTNAHVEVVGRTRASARLRRQGVFEFLVDLRALDFPAADVTRITQDIINIFTQPRPRASGGTITIIPRRSIVAATQDDGPAGAQAAPVAREPHPDDTPVGEANAELACAACISNKRVMAAHPCGHMALCIACSHALLQKKCPVCQAEVAEFKHVFY